MKRTRRFTSPGMAALFALVLLAGAATARAEDAEPEAPTPGDEPEAHQILQEMGKFLASQQSFSVDVLTAHDAVQATGQKIEFIDKRRILLRRPHELHMETTQSDGDRTVVDANAKTITVQTLQNGKYAQIEAKPTLDESVRYFTMDLGMHLPLAQLFLSTLAADLEKRIVQAELVEDTDILGVPTHHVSASTDSVDVQMWIGAGDKPLPYRIVLTYRDAEGEPQFRAQFSDWKLSPWTRASQFEPRIAKDAQRIAFLPQVKVAPPADAGEAK